MFALPYPVAADSYDDDVASDELGAAGESRPRVRGYRRRSVVSQLRGFCSAMDALRYLWASIAALTATVMDEQTSADKHEFVSARN